MAQCTAKSKTSGERCKQPAAPGCKVCRYHGARGGAPIKHGRYSKFAPKRLAADIDASLRDPDLISVREQYAVLDALVKRRLQEMGSDEPAKVWGSVAKLLPGLLEPLGKLREAFGPIAEPDIVDQFKKIVDWHDRLTTIVNNGRGASQAEADIRELFQEQAQLAKQEVKREQALIEGITAKQLGVLVALLLDSITRNVSDVDARRRIQTDIVRAIGPAAS